MEKFVYVTHQTPLTQGNDLRNQIYNITIVFIYVYLFKVTICLFYI